MFLAAFVVMALLFFALRKRSVVPSKFGAAVEGLLSLVKDEIATGIIGPQGAKYAPYLISIFLFILVGNLMEVTPFINFPITSRMALPAFLAILTWVIFVFAGFKEQGLGYVGHIIWPKDVPDRPALAGRHHRVRLDLPGPALQPGGPALCQHGGRPRHAHPACW